MKTECPPKQLEFDGVGRRKLVATFDADHISSDGGLVLLHRTDRRFGLMCKFAACFRDHRAPELIYHSVDELVRQRVFALACSCEDLVDHDTLRNDPLLATVVGKADPAQRLASPSTLNRLELTPANATSQARYRKVVYDAQALLPPAALHLRGRLPAPRMASRRTSGSAVLLEGVVRAASA